MIESLVNYIQLCGYLTRVGNLIPGAAGTITIFKNVGERKYEYHWALSNIELNTLPDFILYQEAERHMRELDETIAKEQA